MLDMGQLLRAVAEILNEKLNLFSPVKVAPLAEKEGISLCVLGGEQLCRYLDGGSDNRLSLSVSVKSESQYNALCASFAISDLFGQGFEGDGGGCKITHTAAINLPALSTLSECGKNYVYTCTVWLDFYIEEDQV